MGKLIRILLLAISTYLWSFGIVDVAIADTAFEAIERIYRQPDGITDVHQYAISLQSSRQFEPEADRILIRSLDNILIYSARIKVEGKTWYRLVMGNFKTSEQAENYRKRVQKTFPGAWLNKRTDIERSMLKSSLLKGTDQQISAGTSTPGKPSLNGINTTLATDQPTTIRSPGTSDPKLAEKLLADARNEFLDKNYRRVLSYTDKVMEIGNSLQQQRALELSGIVRERLKQFAQALAIYRDFLERFPDSELKPSIESRIIGLQTMQSSPRTSMAKTAPREKDEWSSYGFLSQDYRNDEIAIDNLESETVGNSLTTFVNLFARKKTAEETLVLRFDGGLENDFLNDETEPKISQALVDYTDEINGHQWIGGRQNRTAKGVLGRFDGLVYRYLKPAKLDYSLFAGFPVQQTSDGLETERQFFGGGIKLEYWDDVGVDFYLLDQNVGGLTDRQAIGSEILYQYESGFILGQLDYDLFFNELNNVTAITNYRYDENWSYNITIDHRNSPLLATTNAIQGQGVETVEELEDIFSTSDIYQLAEDRTSTGDFLLFGVNRQLDKNRSIYLNLSYSQMGETPASGGVEAIPEAIDRYLSAEYYTNHFFVENDATRFSVRLSNTETTDTISLRGTSRIPASTRGLHYNPNVRLDFRNGELDGADQVILYPSIKLTYKPSRDLSFEAGLGIEYTQYDLPENDEQVYTNYFIGYFYQF